MKRKDTRRGIFLKGLMGGTAVITIVALIGINFLLSRDDIVKSEDKIEQQSVAEVTESPAPTKEAAEETKAPVQTEKATQTPEPTQTPEETAEATQTPEAIENTIVTEGVTYMGVSEAGKPYTYDATEIAKRLSKYNYKNNGNKMVFLTFDDGASTTVTPKVLKVLKENDVKATFFVTGMNIKRGGAKAKKLIKQEFEEGHAIANHSYSHDYKVLYPDGKLNLKNFLNDFSRTDKMLKSILGDDFGTRVIRCPGGYMSWKGMGDLSKYMKENDMASIDWNALSKDAEGKKKNAKQLYQNAVATAKGKEVVVILMHDTYGKEETAKALPKIIKHFKEQGYEFKTLS